MKFLISIGYIDKNIFYPIAGGLMSILFKFLLKKTKSNLSSYPLIISEESSMGMSLAFILLLIYKKKDKKNINNKILNINNEIINSNNSQLIEYEYTDVYEIIIYDKFKYILLTSVLDCIQTIISINIYFDIKMNMWIFDILFISLFSHLIFKNKIYSHHYISIILIILIGIAIDIIAEYYNNISDNILKICLKFFNEIIFSFIIVINKFTIERKFSKSYEICFYQGFFCFIIYSLILAVSCCFDIFNNLVYIKNFNYNELIILFSVIIIQFLYNLFILITNEKTNPCHIIIIVIISQLGYHILDLMDSTLTDIDIIIIIGLCLILFMTLIFNEIIEINCFGLEKNTKKNIIIRSKIDLINSYIDNNEDESEENDLFERGTEVSELNKENNENNENDENKISD